MQIELEERKLGSLPFLTGCGLCAMAFLCSFLALIGSGTAASWQRPPKFNEAWLVSGAISLIAVGLCFYISAKNRQLVIRIVSGLSLVVGLFSLAVPINSYFQSYGDYPWIVVLPLLLTIIGAGVVCGQRMISIGLVVFCAYWLQGLYLPPSVALPATQKLGDFALTIKPSEDSYSGMSLEVTSVSGQPVAKAVDSAFGSVQGRSGPFITDRGLIYGLSWPDPPLNDKAPLPLTLRVIMPRWVRSWDLDIPIQAWHKEPVARLTIPLSADIDSTFKASSPGLSITAEKVKRAKTTSTSPGPDALSLRISSLGKGDRWMRVTNDSGYPLQLDGQARFGAVDQNNPRDIRIYPLDKTKAIHIEFFTTEQMKENRLMFQFRGLPNPRND